MTASPRHSQPDVEADVIKPTPINDEDSGSAPQSYREAFVQGPPGIPRTMIYWVLGAILIFGVGFWLVDRVLASTAPTTQRATTAPLTSGPRITHGTLGPATGRASLHAPLSAFLGISSLKSTPAPGFTLTDAASGTPVSLSSLTGHVVVLTFANAACNDICPVLAQELAGADRLLGTSGMPVTFLTVNTDPLDVSDPSRAPILGQPMLAHLANWRFLTGSIASLNPVWKSYGISITVDRATHAVSHNDLLYIIGPRGNLAWSAVPFANESAKGTFSLARSDIARFATGIAAYVEHLEPRA